MAEDTDPFAAAMATMNESENEETETDPFEAAMGAMDEVADSSLDLGGTEEAAADPFETALEASNTGVSESVALPSAPVGGESGFKQSDIKGLQDIKVNITFEVGRAKMYIADLLSLGQGSVIELHRLVGEELEIFVNGHLMATGEVVVVNEKFGGRIIKILDREERVKRLGPYK